MWTTGGWQFWTDLRYRSGIRLQQNNVHSGCRLVDARGWILARGSLEHCRSVLEGYPADSSDRPLLLLVHGLGRTARSLSRLAQFMQGASGVGEAPAWEVVRFQYATTRAHVADHAAALASFLESFDSRRELWVVAHSLGNIVLRRLYYRWANEFPQERRIVKGHAMLGPPNQGSAIARKLNYVPGIGTIMGSSFQELGSHWETLQTKLSLPPAPFMVVAGNRAISERMNWLLQGPNDGLVTVQETSLVGANEQHVVPVLHTWLMNDPEVQRLVLQFFRGIAAGS